MTKNFLNALWQDQRGQDLIEYAMTAGFVAVAAGAAFPRGIAPSVSRVFSKVYSVLQMSAGQG